MATQNPDTTNVKVESSTTEGGDQQPQMNQQNDNAGGGGGGGGGFQRGGGRGRGRGGRFGGGGRGGGMGNQNRQGGGPQNRGGDRDNKDFQNRKRPLGQGDSMDRIDRMDRMGMDRGDNIVNKLNKQQGPTYEIPPLDMTERKFAGRNRLYVGNIGNEITDQDIQELFSKYGETSEIFLNAQKNFAFVKLDYHANAEKAKRELDGTLLKSRNLKVRFAPSGTALKLRNLTSFVTGDLLHYAFSVFGEVERAVVPVDERGRTTCEGVVEFARKGAALNALRKCQEGCFFLTGSLRPVIAEVYEPIEDTDGHLDKFLPKKNIDYLKEREIGPRFAQEGTFEFEYGTRWKQLYELFRQKEDALKKELEMEIEKLKAEEEYARYEHETEMLREQLRAREMDRERQKRDWEMKERQAEEMRKRQEEQLRRQQEEMQARMAHQEEEMRRRQQENSLFMQAHELNSMLDQQEQAYDQPTSGGYTQGDTGGIRDPKTIMKSFEHNRFDTRRDTTVGGGAMGRGPATGGAMGAAAGANTGGAAGGGRWVNEQRRDDYQNKRRRY